MEKIQQKSPKQKVLEQLNHFEGALAECKAVFGRPEALGKIVELMEAGVSELRETVAREWAERPQL